MTAAHILAAQAIRHGKTDIKADSKITIHDLPPRVLLDEDTTQKYVLIKADLVLDGKKESVYFISGGSKCEFHKDCALLTLEAFQDIPNLVYEVLGGGKIAHSSKDKSIEIFSVSHGFPWPEGNHLKDVVASILKSTYPGYKIDISDRELWNKKKKSRKEAKGE